MKLSFLDRSVDSRKPSDHIPAVYPQNARIIDWQATDREQRGPPIASMRPHPADIDHKQTQQRMRPHPADIDQKQAFAGGR
jgi:hypothetical protein